VTSVLTPARSKHLRSFRRKPLSTANFSPPMTLIQNAKHRMHIQHCHGETDRLCLPLHQCSPEQPSNDCGLNRDLDGPSSRYECTSSLLHRKCIYQKGLKDQLNLSIMQAHRHACPHALGSGPSPPVSNN
jgi:hypothetical protein